MQYTTTHCDTLIKNDHMHCNMYSNRVVTDYCIEVLINHDISCIATLIYSISILICSYIADYKFLKNWWFFYMITSSVTIIIRIRCTTLFRVQVHNFTSYMYYCTIKSFDGRNLDVFGEGSPKYSCPNFSWLNIMNAVWWRHSWKHYPANSLPN